MKKLNFILKLLFISLTILLFNQEALAMDLFSSAFNNDDILPAKFTCDGKNISPALSWKNAPQNTKSFALIADDPDASRGTWTHWILYNIPATTTSLIENIKDLPAKTEIGMNSWAKQEYGGPCPPSGEHRYFFKLYALDTILEFTQPVTSQTLEKTMNGHILAIATIMGRYNRNK